MSDKSLNPLLAQTRFNVGAPNLEYCPPENGAEIGFCGRSNAGKSSVLNTLTGQKRLARVSKTPGRTQMINFFDVPNTGGSLVDLPGYGFAKVPITLKLQWGRNLEKFLTERQTLRALVLVMDVRRPMTSLDQQLLEFADCRKMETLILLTKCDKLSRNQAAKSLMSVRKQRPESDILNFSSSDKTGLTETSSWIIDHLVNSSSNN